MPSPLNLRDGIILSNVQRNNSYHIAEAAESAGYLKKFLTSIYYKPDTAVGHALRWLTGRHDSRARKRLEMRRSPTLPDGKVIDIPLPELIKEGVDLVGTKLHADTRPAMYLTCEAFDWLVATRHMERAAIFHGFEQCALYSLRKARALGAVTVLDQPIIHRTTLERIQREQSERWGVPVDSPKPFWYEQHVARKYKEHDLADYVFGCLDFVKQTMVENGFPGERVFVIPYGADVTFAPIARPPRKGLNILHVGPLNCWKGLPYLFDVMDGLDLPDARLTLIGRNDVEWTPYMNRRMAQLGDRVQHLGTVPGRKCPDLSGGGRVRVSVARGRAGVVCYEAMATGMPVITSDGDVIIRDGVDGLVAPTHDVERWRLILRKLAADRDYRLAIGAAARIG